MTGSGRVRPRLTVRVTCNSNLTAIAPGQPEEVEFLACVDVYARRLANDLGINADVVVATHPEPGTFGVGVPFNLQIDNSRCPVPRVIDPSVKLGPRQLTERVTEALHANRARLVASLSPEHLRELCSDRLAAVPTRITDGQLVAYLVRMIDLGFSVPVALALLDDWHSGPASGYVPDHALELMCSRRFPPTVTVELGWRQYRALFSHRDAHSDGKPPSSGIAGSVPSDLLESLQLMRDGLFWELGVKMPLVRFECRDDLREEELRVTIGWIPGPPRAGLSPGRLLVNETPDRLALLNLKAEPAVNPASRTPCSIVAEEYALVCQTAGLTTWDTGGFAVLVLASELRRQASNLMTLTQVEQALGKLDQAFPMTVFNILERCGIVAVLRVVERLLEEHVSVRDLRSILESMLEGVESIEMECAEDLVVTAPLVRAVLAGTEQAESVRPALCWQLTHSLGRGANEFQVIAFGPATEERLLQARRNPLTSHEVHALHDTLARTLMELNTKPTPPLLASPSVRRRVHELICDEFPGLAVLGRDEVAPGYRANPIQLIEALAPLTGTHSQIS